MLPFGVESNVNVNRVVKQSRADWQRLFEKGKVFHCNTPRQALSCISVDQFL